MTTTSFSSSPAMKQWTRPYPPTWGNSISKRHGSKPTSINYLFGEYSQAQFTCRFDNTYLSDHQCVCNSLVCIIYVVLQRQKSRSPRCWTADDIYVILHEGNSSYYQTLQYVQNELEQLDRLRENEYFLAPSQIKPHQTVIGYDVNIAVGEALFGYVIRGGRKFGGLRGDLIDFFEKHDAGLIMALQRARAIFRYGEQYYLFDPHAVPPNDSAVLIEFPSPVNLYTKLRALIQADDYNLASVTYDLIPIEVISIMKSKNDVTQPQEEEEMVEDDLIMAVDNHVENESRMQVDDDDIIEVEPDREQFAILNHLPVIEEEIEEDEEIVISDDEVTKVQQDKRIIELSDEEESKLTDKKKSKKETSPTSESHRCTFNGCTFVTSNGMELNYHANYEHYLLA